MITIAQATEMMPDAEQVQTWWATEPHFVLVLAGFVATWTVAVPALVWWGMKNAKRANDIADKSIEVCTRLEVATKALADQCKSNGDAINNLRMELK